MRCLLLAALVAVAAASVVKDEGINALITKESMATWDVKSKQLVILKLMKNILQPSIFPDILEVAREWSIEDNMDKYLKVDVVREFIAMFKVGMLPRGEVFVHSDEMHMEQAIKVFRLLYFAKDFDVLIRTAAWLRERINHGIFLYTFNLAVFHRLDCNGITLPPLYEVYPNLFVDSHVINKAMMIKMSKGITDPVLANYLGIKVTDKNTVIIDYRKGLRHALTKDDILSYFTEDIDLNMFMYHVHLHYPYWMTEDIYSVNKERRGETMMYIYQQLLARLRMERLGHSMCDIKSATWSVPLETGYWPKLRLHTGDEMPMRMNNMLVLNDDNILEKRLIEDLESLIQEGIVTGKITLRDGTTLNIRKPEDIENLSRLLLGGIGIVKDDAKTFHLMNLLRKLFTYNLSNTETYSYIPTALDMYMTSLRDPLFWRMMKRVMDNIVLFKEMLPSYTHEELDFPGVKVERIVTDKLVTFIDEYDMDITNALYLDQAEMKKQDIDNLFVARMRRLNHQPFKMSIDVISDKAVDAVVRVFIGPKINCMGRLVDLNNVRLDMLEIDSFVYKLETGKNTIVRDSTDMKLVIGDRVWTRHMIESQFGSSMSNDWKMVDGWWHKTRLRLPQRLLLPLGTLGGLPLQMFVIVTPVRTGLLLPTVDISVMKERHACYMSACIDTMPLGFPFDRRIDLTRWYTKNMLMTDVLIYRKDMTFVNMSKDLDTSKLVMKRDDLTYLDSDMLVRWSYKDLMMMSTDDMSRMSME